MSDLGDPITEEERRVRERYWRERERQYQEDMANRENLIQRIYRHRKAVDSDW